MACYVLCAVGADYRWQAGLAAQSVKAQMPHARIVVYADEHIDSPHIEECRILRPDPAIQPAIKAVKVLKLLAIRDAPFERFAYIDCDVFVTTPLDDVFSVLDHFEFGAIQDNWRFFAPDTHYLPPINGGILFVKRSPAVQRLLEDWPQRYLREEPIADQITLRQLFYTSPIKSLILAPELNLRCNEVIHVSGRARIIHQPYGGGLHFPAAAAHFLNLSTNNRIFDPHSGQMTVMGDAGVEVLRMADHADDMQQIMHDFLHPPE